MVKHFDHCTIVVRDVDRAKMFFGLLGFKETTSVVIAGEPFASYMGVPGIEADHVTLVLENASPTNANPTPALPASRATARSAYSRPVQARDEPHLFRGREHRG
jgi:catechol 2,3-dioxygenase-like lactoylglutathione lyase family enzyme